VLSLPILITLGAAVVGTTALLDRDSRRPNVLFVTIDTLRSDHCSSYGYPKDTTPNLDRLAREGVRFSTVYAPMPTTLPSHAAMFTGLRPSSLGVLRNGVTVGDHVHTLAEVLRSHGYKTAAVVSAFPVHRRFGLAQGFSYYDDAFGQGAPSGGRRWWEGVEVPSQFSRRADATRELAVGWLEREGYLDVSPPSRPFFLWVHLFDPHHPYEPPAEHRARFLEGAQTDKERLLARYDGEVHFADHELGRLLDALRVGLQRENTVVIVAGDHGEGLGDHGYPRHGLLLYEEAVRVPLVFHGPGRLPRREVDATAELMDLTPTILGLLGLRPPAAEGRDFAALLLGKGTAPTERPVLLERRFFESPEVDGIPVRGRKQAVVLGRYKYVEAPEEGTRELYDLSVDPAETRNLVEEHPSQARRLAALLPRSPRPQGPNAAGIPAEAMEHLRALGYVE